MTFVFKKASKEQAKARVAIVGPSGSGKTYSALAIAQGMGDRVAVIDTEHGSARKYAGAFAFDVLELDSFEPDTYVKAIRAAESSGYDVLVIDSLSHAWMGKGGALEQVDNAARRYQGNSFAGWRDVTPQHNRMVEALVSCKCHLVVTMRSKTEWVLEETEGRNGKRVKTPRRVGLAPVQRDGLEYEFDVVGDIDVDHHLSISKTRCPDLDGKVFHKPGQELADAIRVWLDDGERPPARYTGPELVRGPSEQGQRSAPAKAGPATGQDAVFLLGEQAGKRLADASLEQLEAYLPQAEGMVSRLRVRGAAEERQRSAAAHVEAVNEAIEAARADAELGDDDDQGFGDDDIPY